MTSTSARRTALTVAALVVAWSSTFTAITVAVADCPVAMLAGLRCLVGGAALGAVALVGGRRPRLGEGAGVYAWLTAFNVLGFFGLQTLSLAHLPSGLAAILIYLQPVVTVLLARPLLGEPVGLSRVTGAVLAFLGIVVVGLESLAGSTSILGIVAGAGAAVCWSFGTITVKRTVGRVDPLWSVALPFLAGGVLLTAVGMLVPSEAIRWSPRFAVAFSWTALVGTALAWLWWFSLVRSGQASTAAVNLFLVPILAVVLGIVLLGERLHPSLYAGIALVCAGVFVVNRRPVRGR